MTDHQALKHLLEQKLTQPLQHKRLTKLLGLDYEIQYKRGVENGVADAFSRRRMEGASDSNREAELQVAQVCAISSIQPRWTQELLESYIGDAQAQQKLSELVLTQCRPRFSYEKWSAQVQRKAVCGHN